MFDRILIANRGEIACRVIRTAKRLGIGTVAVFSDADAQAPHVRMANEAVRLGPAPARESYLLIDRLVEACRRTGVQAVHPGYGFLSENAHFADALEAAGIAFIGPPADAIRAMGSKSQAKALMAEAGVPLVPGYHGQEQDPDFLAAEAEKIGYPLLIKASAGGGGKGMRRVDGSAEFADALAGCKREAAASFGDEHVLIERFVTRPRHIEMQVFADAHGNAVHLFERDCSVQRRHQKVIEEAPAPFMPDSLRAAMGKAATDAARAIGYRGAGTVEFIAETAEDGAPADFFFMEMNTRLQVEHPVTEAITGQDLVEWQLRVAAGDPLPLRQEAISVTGHAVEARLYAEDADGGFLPATGRLDRLRFPEGRPGLRIDSGVVEGDSVTVHYDPMIAKLIAHGADRDRALARLADALEATEVSGLVTNREFLSRLVRHPAFAAARLDTGFIEKHADDLIHPAGAAVPEVALALAALGEIVGRAEASGRAAAAGGDPWSPWALSTGWRLNDTSFNDLHYDTGAGEVRVRCRYRADGSYSLDLPGGTMEARAERRPDGRLAVELDGIKRTVFVAVGMESVTVVDGAETHRIHRIDRLAAAGIDETDDGKLVAPMPGKVTAVHVAAGEAVSAGAALMVLEAMKMEHTIRAPKDGTIAAVRFAVGESVADGEALITFEDG
ncbi:acetyl/propionyl/methylcrotonyl-CoA carboxylase subunit alpha [Marivibrio halodurans]|uniref:acetyl/propionyl/methylcrotonyl-CoA carboxylase subunit alpha n=1 Tax=Marivibrio halodurans TaxID=2039722 RepID=UPI0031BA95C0